MESRSSRSRCGRVLVLGVVLFAGCRMGLTPAPPDEDAGNPDAVIPEYQASPNPYARSAFAGETLESEGHQGHQGHRGHAGKGGHGQHEGASEGGP